jgi:hypothetical protein
MPRSVLDSHLDELYGTALEEFVRTRNGVARQLVDLGEPQMAKEVRSLRKPSLPAWAINQAIRSHAADVKDLLDVQEALTDVQDAPRLRELSSRRRRLVGRLVDAASEVLAEAGRSVSPQTLERVRKTLMSANSTHEQDLLRRGRLERELHEHGFDGLFASATLAEEVVEQDPSSGRRKQLEAAETLSRKASVAAREAAELRRAADRLKRDAERAAAAASAAEDKAIAAQDAAGRAERTARRARERL